MFRARRFAAIAFVSLVPYAPRAQQAPGDVPFSMSRLSLDLRVDYGNRTVGGTATLLLRNASSRPAAVISLLLNRLMTVSRVTGLAGSDLPFTHDVVVFRDDPVRQVSNVLVTLPNPVAAGDSFTVTVHYGGVLTGYTETGSLYIRDQVNREFTIIREDAYAFPTPGVPSLRANRAALREPFAFSARVTVPSDLVVAMGGSRGERLVRDSLVTWSYHSTSPVPFLNITIAPYRLLEAAGARIFHFPSDSAGASMMRDGVVGALQLLERWYGPLAAVPDLAVMEIPEGFGSQASLRAGVILTADAFRDRAQLRQLYHELSHLWNAPDAERPSPRWNEGLATFLQWRMAAELDGWSDWDARVNASAESLMRRCAQMACDSVAFADYGKAGRTDLSYSVGFLMFYALHGLLGAEAFDRTYRDYFQRNRERGATAAELARIFRAADPRSEQVLSDWFFTTRWISRLRAGETVAQMIEAYRRP